MAENTPAESEVLKLHDLKPAPGSKKSRQRVGRGEASKGKTAGRGTKGTKARYQVRPGFEGGQLPLHMRLPKLRGFKSPFRVEYSPVNLNTLNELFPEGGEVTAETLINNGVARRGMPVKILGSGDVSAALTVKAHAFSGTAEEKITAAGGTVEKLPLKNAPQAE